MVTPIHTLKESHQIAVNGLERSFCREHTQTQQ